MVGEASGVAGQEVPVQRGVRTGRVADRLSRIVAATGAVVRHALDVAPAGRVGLGDHAPAVGVLAHAQHVGQFRPLHRVDIKRRDTSRAPRAAGPPFGHRRGDHPPRRQQLEVERGRQQRVVKAGLALPHRVLVLPEQRQPLCDERIQRGVGLRRGQRPVERIEAAGMCPEARLDQRQHPTRDVVRRERRRSRQQARPFPAERLAVVGVVVPRTAGRLAVVIEQHALAPAQPAVEVLHAQRLAALRPRGELARLAQEVRVGSLRPRDAGIRHRARQRLRQSPLAWHNRHHALWPQRSEVGGKRVVQRCVGVLVQRPVRHAVAACTQRIAEMPHRRQEHRDACLGAPDLGRLVRDLGHPGHVQRGIEVLEHRRRPVELVAEHQHQVAHRWRLAHASTKRTRRVIEHTSS